MRNTLTMDEDLTGSGGLEPGDQPKQCGLATSGGTDDGHEFFGLNIDGYLIHSQHRTESFRDLMQDKSFVRMFEI
jgi:hypothetical protein